MIDNSVGELANHGTSFHKRVICRSDAIVSRSRIGGVP